MLQELAVDAVLDRVHHLSLGEHRAALLVDAAFEEERCKGNLVERLQHLEGGGADVDASYVSSTIRPRLETTPSKRLLAAW